MSNTAAKANSSSTLAGSDPENTLVVLHGWGSGSWIWQDVAQAFDDSFDLRCIDLPGYGENLSAHCESVDDFLQWFERSVLASLPAGFSLLGWSLGGALATLVAERYPDRVAALFTVATNPVFVARPDWENGMPAQQFDGFRSQLEKDTAKLLQRFNVLQSRGGRQLNERARWLSSLQQQQPASVAALHSGLDWLEELDLRTYWRRLPMPVFHSYAASDSLVPVAVASEVERLYPGHNVRVYPGASHLLFLDEADNWSSDLREDLQELRDSCVPSISELIDKPAVAAAFDRAAASYDHLAEVQQRVANDLVSGIVHPWPDNPLVVDLGSGTGFVARRFFETNKLPVLQLDISGSMLHEAQKAEVIPAGQDISHTYLQADIDSLPFAAGTIDGFMSSLSLQWSKDPAGLFGNARRALKPGGYFGFTTLLPGSLAELAAAVQHVGGSARSHDFYDEATLQELVAEAGLSVQSWELRTYTQYFDSARALLDSVHGIGAGNHRLDRPQSPLGKAGYRALLAALEAQVGSDGKIPLTYNVLFAGVTPD